MTKKEARRKAEEIIKKDRSSWVWGSCWKCNPCHKHLKKTNLLYCFACGHWYCRGIDITYKP